MDATDAINAGLWTTLSGAAGVIALVGAGAANGGVWYMQADPKTALPLVKFQVVIADYDYSFGGLSAERYVYKVTGYGTDTSSRAGSELATALAAAARTALTDASFAVSGYELLLCRPYAGVPPDLNDSDEHYAGVLVEVIVTPA